MSIFSTALFYNVIKTFNVVIQLIVLAIRPLESNQDVQYLECHFVSWLIVDYFFRDDIACQNDTISDITNHVNILIELGYFHHKFGLKWQLTSLKLSFFKIKQLLYCFLIEI